MNKMERATAGAFAFIFLVAFLFYAFFSVMFPQ